MASVSSPDSGGDAFGNSSNAINNKTARMDVIAMALPLRIRDVRKHVQLSDLMRKENVIGEDIIDQISVNFGVVVIVGHVKDDLRISFKSVDFFDLLNTGVKGIIA